MKALYFSFQGKREYQEDTVFTDTNNDIYAICDGVGGTTDGGKASRYVAKLIAQNVSQLKTITTTGELEESLRSIHDKLLLKYNENELGYTYGTTIAIIVINKGIAYLANIGDTKLFCISEDDVWISKDHSAVQELFDVGILSSEKEMLSHPYRNRITSSISTLVLPKELLINTNSIELNKSKYKFLIASDGALEKWTNSILTDHFNCHHSNLTKQWNLFKEMAACSSDNSSAILVY